MQLILLTMALTSTTAMAGEPTDFAVTQRTPLLDGRLTVEVPAPMVSAPRTPSLMGATHSDVSETRLVLDDGDVRVVLMATELFSLGLDRFEQTVSEWSVGRPEGSATVLDDSHQPLTAALWTPAALDWDREAVCVRRLLIQDQDGLLMQVDVYVSPPAEANETLWTEFVAGLVDSIELGERTFDMADSVVRFDYDSPRWNLPAGYGVSVSTGADFQVVRARKLLPFGEVLSVGVYVGGHPSSFMVDGDSTNVTTLAERTILGQDTQWAVWQTTRRFNAETLVHDPATGMYTHMFVDAPSDARRTEGMRIFRGLAVQGRP